MKMFSRRLGLALALAACPLLVVSTPAEADTVPPPSSITELEASLPKWMKEHHVPGLSIAVLRNGRVAHAKGYGREQVGQNTPVTPRTMFSVGSVSKVLTAVLTLRTVERGAVDLDTDVNRYLRRWKVPVNDYTRKTPVTLRRILSHTAGLTVHGFADFQPTEKLPNLVQILNGTPPAKSEAVYVDIPVGSRFRYSGGGTTVAQLLIEDVNGQSLDALAQAQVFKRLGMQRSSFLNPLPARFEPIAKAHDRSGRAVALPRGYESMPESGASGLWTTPSDLSKVLLDLWSAYHGKKAKLLKTQTVKKMASTVAPSEFGLGPRVFVRDGRTVIAHGGANDSYRSHFRINLDTGNGYVLFTNGEAGGALIRQIRASLDPMLGT